MIACLSSIQFDHNECGCWFHYDSPVIFIWLVLSAACGDDSTAADAATDARGDAPRDVATDRDTFDARDGDPPGDASGDADPSGDAADDADAALGYCDPSIGVTQPLPVCTASAPCTEPLFGDTPIDHPTETCVCAGEHPSGVAYDDGAPLIFADDAGLQRCACLYVPEVADVINRVPMLVFFHGSGGSAQDVYRATSLRTKAIDADLSGDPSRPGFALLAIQARNLHWPTGTDEDGPKHDFFHRDLASPSGNPDLAAFDHFVDEVVSHGIIDSDRIYTSGWSNGARFAELVAIARHDRATPNGIRVAAAAVYSGTDPFGGIEGETGCALATYPSATVPVFLVGRACDVLPCDEDQADDLRSEGLPIDDSDVMSTWVDALSTRVGATVERIIVSGTGVEVGACTGPVLCSRAVALVNHLRWPDGVNDGGDDHEPAMLAFLRDHPLP